MTDTLMPLEDHLEELRRRVILCILAVFTGFLLSYYWSGMILGFMTRGIQSLVFLSPTEAFFSRLRVALFSGLFLASPVLFYQIWRFVSSGLLERERGPVLTYTLLSLVLFLAGAVFAYTLIIPLAMKFLIGFATARLRPFISVNQYISFVGILLLVFGFSFEVPLALLFLIRMGFVSPETLKKNRRSVIVLMFILAAVLTPPDVITQILLAVPLIFLYELGIILAKVIK